MVSHRNLLLILFVCFLLFFLFFVIGFDIGFNSKSNLSFIFTDYLSAICTLIATFLGAFFAFHFQNIIFKKDENNKKISDLNNVFFLLLKKYNFLCLIKHDHIEPNSGNGYFVEIPPLMPEKLDDYLIDTTSLNFLLNTEFKEIPFDLYIEQQRFKEVIKFLNYRSTLYKDQVSPVLIKNGFFEGGKYSLGKYKEALGISLYSELQKTTDQMITHFNSSALSIMKLKNKLHSACLILYPGHEFVDFSE